MDLALAKFIRSRAEASEIEKSYNKILAKMVEILTDLLKERKVDEEQVSDMLSLYEGNIWSIIQKFEKDTNDDSQSDSDLSNIEEASDDDMTPQSDIHNLLDTKPENNFSSSIKKK